MEKPKKRSVIYYDWHKAVQYIEERYGCDLNKKAAYDTNHRGREEGDYYDFLCSEHWDYTPKEDYVFIDHALLKMTALNGLKDFLKITEALLREFGYIHEAGDSGGNWTACFFVSGGIRPTSDQASM